MELESGNKHRFQIIEKLSYCRERLKNLVGEFNTRSRLLSKEDKENLSKIDKLLAKTLRNISARKLSSL